jgi:hypothetical protein
MLSRGREDADRESFYRSGGARLRRFFASFLTPFEALSNGSEARRPKVSETMVGCSRARGHFANILDALFFDGRR